MSDLIQNVETLNTSVSAKDATIQQLTDISATLREKVLSLEQANAKVRPHRIELFIIPFNPQACVRANLDG